MRATWTNLSDDQLLSQCEVDTYRASGPGGQKRNKTSSAVRLRHPPSGLLVIAEESRSQHENRAKALKRLRQALYLKLREAVSHDSATIDLHVGRKDARFWPAVGVALDVLESVEGRVSDAASVLGVTTSQLVAFLETEPKVWEQANQVRARFGHKLLRT
jgi:hypothetical protein